eukprot:c21644_g4_i1 orf=2-919(-)
MDRVFGRFRYVFLPSVWMLQQGSRTAQAVGLRFGCYEKAIRVEKDLRSPSRADENCFSADSAAYVSLLRECGRKKSLEIGRRVHAHIIKGGFNVGVYLGNHLILMYKKCQNVVDARRVFDRMPRRNVFSWNAMIGVYVQHRQYKEAYRLFQQMQKEGVQPDAITFVSILSSCASLDSRALGKLIHAHSLNRKHECDNVVGNALINMYWKCGSIDDACGMFAKMPARNVVSWNSMIGGYARHGHSEEAFRLLLQMHRDGVEPNDITFICILIAFASSEALALGKLVHAFIIGAGFKSDVLGNALVNM